MAKIVIIAITAILLIAVLLILLPVTLDSDGNFVIEVNEGLQSVASRLHDKGYISSPDLFVLYNYIF